MSLLRALQGRRKSRRIQKQPHKALLVLDRQANDLGCVDCPVRDLLSGGNHKIADTPALQFRGAPDDPERIGSDASFDAGGADCLLGHGGNTPKEHCTGLCLTVQLAEGGTARGKGARTQRRKTSRSCRVPRWEWSA